MHRASTGEWRQCALARGGLHRLRGALQRARIGDRCQGQNLADQRAQIGILPFLDPAMRQARCSALASRPNVGKCDVASKTLSPGLPRLLASHSALTISGVDDAVDDIVTSVLWSCVDERGIAYSQLGTGRFFERKNSGFQTLD